MQITVKGRGAQLNPHNPFLSEIRSKQPFLFKDEKEEGKLRTNIIEVDAKSILNKITSPDVPGEYSINPYQGCEHGCAYCYARNTHPYWGYSAGLDFETQIMVKRNAPELLDKALSRKSWTAKPIMLSGNTDCYQPIEKKFMITRRLLEVFWKHKHPVSIITKNSLILRDMDILKNMALHNLVHVAVSINTLDDKLRQKLEPRTASVNKRLQLIKALTDQGIPVTALAAPIIPGLNDQDIIPLVKKVAEAGARTVKQIVVRLNGDVAEIFSDWLGHHYPDRRSKVLNKIKSLHGGKLGNSQLRKRMKGSGIIADIIHQQFDLARRLFLMEEQPFSYNLDLYEMSKRSQLSLF